MDGVDNLITTGGGLGGEIGSGATEAGTAGFVGGPDAADLGGDPDAAGLADGPDAAGFEGGPGAGPGATDDAVATEAETATAVVGEWLGATETLADAAALEAGCRGTDAAAPAAEVAGTPGSADLFRDARLPDTESLLLRRLPANSSTSSTSES